VILPNPPELSDPTDRRSKGFVRENGVTWLKEDPVSLSIARLNLRLALGCLVGAASIVGCATHQNKHKSTALSSLQSPQNLLTSVKLPKFNVPELKAPNLRLKAPEFTLKVPSIPKPDFGSKFASDAKKSEPTKFRLASTGKKFRVTKSGQTLGTPNLNTANQKPADTAKTLEGSFSKSDTMALLDEASESVQDAFSAADSMPLGDHAMASHGATSVQATMQPRDASSLPSQFRDISESEMLHIGLSRSPVLRSLGIRILDNPQSATTIYDVAINESDPFFGPHAALAEFDSVLSASLNSQNNDRVFNNATLGGQVQELTQDLVNMNAGLQRRTMTGATWDISTTTGYDNNNRAGNSFSNYWETQLEAGVRQPLLQGAGKQFNRIAGPNARPGFNFSNGIVIARMNNQISQADFEISLRSYVRDLYSAYWNLVRQYAVYDSVLQSQKLSYETWQTVLAKGKADMEGGEANKEAQARAKYYSYRREVQNALGGDGGLYVAERRLRQLIGLPAVDGQLLRPTDAPVSARYVFDYDHLVARAMKGRTELRRQNTKIQQQSLRLIAAKNFLLPQMDLIGRYRLRGFGDDLTGSGPRFSSAYDDFGSLDHQEWEFGVEMGVTAGRRQAHAAVRNAKLQLSRERVIYCEQQRMVRHQISEAFAEVSSAYYAMQSSSEQVGASRERLQASEALFEADKIQIEFLLDAQEELLRAEVQLAADQARYSLSLVEINNTSGTLLRDIGVNIAQRQCGTHVHYFQTASTPATTEGRLPHPSAETLIPPSQTDANGTKPDDSDEMLPPPPPGDKDAEVETSEEQELAPQLKPAPKKRLPEELINAPRPKLSLDQFLPSAVSFPKLKVPSKSISFATKAKPEEKSVLLKSPALPEAKPAIPTRRVLAKPTFKPSESWSKKAAKTKSTSRFQLPKLFRSVPTSTRTVPKAAQKSASK
jgi:outer membrane protein TolC